MAVKQLREGLAAYLERALDIEAEELDEGDLPPTPAAVEALREHFAAVDALWPASTPVPLPFVCVPGDGDVSLEWSEGKRRLYMTVFPDGLIRMFQAEVEEGRAANARTTSRPALSDTLAGLEWIAGAA